MEQKINKPSILKMAYSDTILTLLLFIIICPLVFQMTGIIDSTELFVYAYLIALFVSILCFILRVRFVNYIFNNGIEVKGEIKKFVHPSGPSFGYIKGSYTYNGTVYNYKRILINDVKLKENKSKPIMIVDPNNPKRALIRDRYI